MTHIVHPSHHLEAPGRVLNMARYPYISAYSRFVLIKITPGLKHFIDFIENPNTTTPRIICHDEHVVSH